MECEPPARFARERLPRGRHHLSAAEVAENQRWRLLGAAAELFYQQGRLGITSKGIATGAGVSASSFYRYFDDVADCLHAAFDVAADSLMRALKGRCRDAPDRLSRARSGAEALGAFAAAEPQLACLLGTELAVAQKTIVPRRRRLIARLAALLAGSWEDEVPEAGGHIVGEQFIVAALALCCNRREDEAPVPPDFATQLTSLLEPAAG
jgi:AcrR family transcriptional regulator